MKLLTLNTHSLMEKDYERKLSVLVGVIEKHKIDVVALQEIMQPIEGKPSKHSHINCGKIPLKDGNHALNIVKELERAGQRYNLVWCGFKRSYDRFDEGLAILSCHSIEQAAAHILTPFDDYDNWKTRKAIGAKIHSEWFFSVHMGWWDSFEQEFLRLKQTVSDKESVWLMGDFNSPSSERDRGYDLVKKSGFFDTFTLAVNKDSGFTANTKIDGWSGDGEDVRIDYIFSNKERKIDSSFVIFNGENEDIVSDHYGILVTT